MAELMRLPALFMRKLVGNNTVLFETLAETHAYLTKKEWGFELIEKAPYHTGYQLFYYSWDRPYVCVRIKTHGERKDSAHWADLAHLSIGLLVGKMDRDESIRRRDDEVGKIYRSGQPAIKPGLRYPDSVAGLSQDSVGLRKRLEDPWAEATHYAFPKRNPHSSINHLDDHYSVRVVVH